MGKISQQDILNNLVKSRVIKKDENPRFVQGRDLQSQLYHPNRRLFTRGNNAVDPRKKVNYAILQRVAEKAWLINAIISHVSRQIRPYLKPTTDDNIRGYQIRLKDRSRKATKHEREQATAYSEFFFNTGYGDDPDREDTLVQWGVKAVRDILRYDEVATEVQRRRKGDPWAFWAVDASTIYRVWEEGYDGNDKIKFIQEVDTQVLAQYTRRDLIFDVLNPRTDIEYSGYGYSYVEQAIDLIVAQINTFAYNMGVFTEDRLPRGMLLLNGGADLDDVEALEEYIVSIMSGGPQAKWHIPIVPSGAGVEGQNQRRLEWVSFQQNNQDMQFSQWTEFLWSSVAALWGVDLEELGIRTQKSTQLLGDNVAPRLEASRSRLLGTVLGFLEQHLQRIMNDVDPSFDFEFVGYEKDDEQQKNQTRESELRTFKTIDELRAESDLEPFDEEWSKMPLNPVAVQVLQSSQQQAMMGGGMDGMQSGMDDVQEGPSEDEEMFRSMMFGEDESDVRKSLDDDEEIIIEV
jgi:hypothetical protein